MQELYAYYYFFGTPRGELSPAPPPLPPSHSGSVHGTFLASRGACSCRGRQFANSTHSDVIDNRKPLRGPDDFFLVLLPPPTSYEKVPPRAAARVARA